MYKDSLEQQLFFVQLEVEFCCFIKEVCHRSGAVIVGVVAVHIAEFFVCEQPPLVPLLFHEESKAAEKTVLNRIILCIKEKNLREAVPFIKLVIRSAPL